MSENEIIEKIKMMIVEGDTEQAVEKVKEALDANIDSQTILNNGVIKGAEQVGKFYEKGEYFLSDMLMAGDAINQVMNILRPLLKETNNQKSSGIILIGTPEGDIHDIGKNLVISLLMGQGFDIIDLGVDVPPKKFVEEAQKSKCDIIGISGLLTVTVSKMRETVVELRDAGIKSKIILGGGILSEKTCKNVGGDAWTKDGWEGVNIIKDFLNNPD